MLLKDLKFGRVVDNEFWCYAYVQKPGTNTWVEVARATEKNGSWCGRYAIHTYTGDPRSPGHSHFKSHSSISNGYADAVEAQCLLFEIFRQPDMEPPHHEEAAVP